MRQQVRFGVRARLPLNSNQSEEAPRLRIDAMSELGEQRWSVVSERGREAARLPYADAAALVRRLTGERVHGLCVITDEAAARLAAPAPAANGGKPEAGTQRAAPRRRAVKTS
jgi:hypothetical protein